MQGCRGGGWLSRPPKGGKGLYRILLLLVLVLVLVIVLPIPFITIVHTPMCPPPLAPQATWGEGHVLLGWARGGPGVGMPVCGAGAGGLGTLLRPPLYSNAKYWITTHRPQTGGVVAYPPTHPPGDVVGSIAGGTLHHSGCLWQVGSCTPRPQCCSFTTPSQDLRCMRRNLKAA